MYVYNVSLYLLPLYFYELVHSDIQVPLCRVLQVSASVASFFVWGIGIETSRFYVSLTQCIKLLEDYFLLFFHAAKILQKLTLNLATASTSGINKPGLDYFLS